LRLLDQPQDARVGARLGAGGGAQVERRPGVDHAACDRVAIGPLDRFGLAGQGRLIQHGGRPDDQPVDWDHLARLDQQQVPRPHRPHRHVGQRPVPVARPTLGRVPVAVCDPRGAGQQRAELPPCPVARVGLEQAARGEHHGDHGTGQVLTERERPTERQHSDQVHAGLLARQAPGHRSGQRHQPGHDRHTQDQVGKIGGAREPGRQAAGQPGDGRRQQQCGPPAR
jgi:hypothetical protein